MCIEPPTASYHYSRAFLQIIFINIFHLQFSDGKLDSSKHVTNNSASPSILSKAMVKPTEISLINLPLNGSLLLQ